MKVILLQDVAKIGKRSSVVSVPDGYAINQLIPKKMAEPATPANLKRNQQQAAIAAATKEADGARYAAAIQALTGKDIVVQAEANEQGHLFQAIHESAIASSATSVGIDIDTRMITVPSSIKSLGKHEVHLVEGQNRHAFMIDVIKK